MLLNEYLLKVLQVIKLNFRIFSRMKKAEQDFKIDRLTDSILNTISGDSFQTEVSTLKKTDVATITKKPWGHITSKIKE